MKRELKVHDFPPQYEDAKLKGWNHDALGIDVPKGEAGVLGIAKDEELYESRVYGSIMNDGWELKILAKRKRGADTVTVLFKTRIFASVPAKVTMEKYHKLVTGLECMSEKFLDLEHVSICHADDYERVMRKMDEVK